MGFRTESDWQEEAAEHLAKFPAGEYIPWPESLERSTRGICQGAALDRDFRVHYHADGTCHVVTRTIAGDMEIDFRKRTILSSGALGKYTREQMTAIRKAIEARIALRSMRP